MTARPDRGLGVRDTQVGRDRRGPFLWRSEWQPISAPTSMMRTAAVHSGYGRGAIGFGTRATAGVVPGYTYTKEDDEADSVFDQIDAKMKSRKRKKKKDEKADDKSKKQKNDSVHDQFKDLKAEMSTVTWDEWDAIPDIGDTTVKHHKPERFMPVPEKLILEKVADTSLYSPGSMDCGMFAGKCSKINLTTSKQVAAELRPARPRTTVSTKVIT